MLVEVRGEIAQACLVTGGKAIVLFCDYRYFTCKKACFRIFRAEGKRPLVWGRGTELSYPNRFLVVVTNLAREAEPSCLCAGAGHSLWASSGSRDDYS